MSASPAPAETCPQCGAEAPARAAFCPACGTTLDDRGGRTLEVELPPPEEGPVPISMHDAEPRWLGLTPPSLLLGLAGLLALVAIVLFAVGHWPYGLILLGIAALLLAVFLEAARRGPQRHAAVRASNDARERVHSRLEEWRTRSTTAAEARRIRTELLLVESERKTRLSELGAAAYAHDGTAEAAARAALTELDLREEELRGRLDEQLRDAGERIRRARLQVEETMMVAPVQPPDPNPAQPPQPAVVPEPYPPPDEGNPPEPARIPEPTPDQPRRED